METSLFHYVRIHTCTPVDDILDVGRVLFVYLGSRRVLDKAASEVV